MAPVLATDMITFYHPRFWGVQSFEEFQAWVSRSPDKFWQTVMQTLVETGITGIELTFGPASIENAVKAFGSGPAFKQALDQAGLKIVSAFIADAPSWSISADQAAIVADAERRAAFLGEVGASILVTGLPMRKTFGERPPFFIDASYMGRMADIAHAVGEAVSRHGVKLAIHTESNSSLWYERDIDLFMSFTDPRYVWLCPDSCHIALGGGDPVGVARRHAQRILLAHWKDAVGPIDADLVIDATIYDQQQRFMADFGKGIVDWNGWSQAMLGTPGRDIALIELDAAIDPTAALEAGRLVVESMHA
jgi:sugar phosphate isomerase/epimerase